jgi:serine/threonine protein kinase
MDEDLSRSTIIGPESSLLVPPRDDGEIGHLAHYRVVKQLGQGGMGVVYQAEDENLRRLVALKVMRGDFANHPEARARFHREAQSVAALRHDNIVTIYQVGEDRGIPFLAMEFLKGKSLDDWLRPDRRATVAETLVIGRQVAAGLAAAHAEGMIHRDIKPGNLWLEEPKGRVKILEFGLARQSDGELSELTQRGSMLGTPAYMAPEQMRGEIVDYRCDLFSLGCVLYRMITGRLPFQGNTVYAVMAAVASETPPAVTVLNPGVPQRLSDLIARLLAKDARDRPASAQEVFDELRAIHANLKAESGPMATVTDAAPKPTAPVPESPRGFKVWPIAVAVGLLALVVLAVVLARGRSRTDDPTRKSPSGPTAEGSTDHKSEKPPVPPGAEPIDLLKLVDVERDGKQGLWGIRNGTLRGRAEHGERGCQLIVPYDPPTAYRLSFQVTRIHGQEGSLTCGLASGRHRFAFLIDAEINNSSEKPGLYSGLTWVDDQRLEERKRPQHGLHLALHKPVKVVCTVKPDDVEITVDDQTIVTYQSSLDHLHRTPGGRAFPKKAAPRTRFGSAGPPIFLRGSHEAAFQFSHMTLEPLGDDPGRPNTDPD